MNLDNRFFYRLTKVLNITIFIALLAFMLFILWKNIPPKNPDDLKSVIVCGKTRAKMPIAFLGILLHGDYPQSWTDKDDKIVTNFCVNKYHGHSVLQGGLASIYTVKIIYCKRDWSNYFHFALTRIPILITFLLLVNLFFETLLYLAFGKKLSWRWILFLKK